MVIGTKKPIMLGEKPASTREMWGTRQALRPMRCDFSIPMSVYSLSQNLPSCHGDQALPTGLAHSQLLTGLQHHRAFALPFAKYFAHLIHIDDDRSMDAYKFSRIESTGQLLDGLAQHETFAAHMQACVIIRRFNPFNLVHIHEGILAA